MGREIKRVALDFDWPLNIPWKGFINPYTSQKCTACDGSGYNPEAKQIADDWYDFKGTGRKWCYNITQDEVDALIEHGRLYDFTHEFIPGQGWQPKDPQPVVTAEMVNVWSQRGMGHDAINQGICVRARAERLGVYGDCPACGGEGEIWFSDHIKELYEGWWDNEKYEPPVGEGWQVWETVSEGSPVTPVFPTADALIDYLVEGGDDWDRKRNEGGWSRENAERFVKDTQWAPSLIMVRNENGVQINTPRDGDPT